MNVWVREDGTHYHLSDKCPLPVEEDYREIELDEDWFWLRLVRHGVDREITIWLRPGKHGRYVGCPCCVAEAVTRFLVNEACIGGYVPPTWKGTTKQEGGKRGMRV